MRDHHSLIVALHRAARAIEAHGLMREAEVCRMAASEIGLLERIIINDPVELPIEEGDRANG